MDTLINLILAAALQFTGAHVAHQKIKINHQEVSHKKQQCNIAPSQLIDNNKQICKETSTQ